MLIFSFAAGSVAGKFEDAQENETSSFLPGGAESVEVVEQVKRFPAGEVANAVTVIAREGQPLGAQEQADARQLVETLNAKRTDLMEESEGPIPSEDGQALLVITPVRNSPDDPDPFLDTVDLIRAEAHALRGDGVQVEVTGAAGYGADAIDVFGDINGQLLLAAGGLVLILLILIYRSPIFWAIPFFTVLLAEVSSRGFGYLLSEAGVTINGQTGGILPVLVFGAGTDYALLLVSRYREELRRHDDKHDAMAIAMRSAGPAIFASGLTVIAALLTLTLAEVNSTAGLGPVGAMGIALAMISSLTVLPALLTICGRRAFWSPGLDMIPHPGQAGNDETHGFWRGVGDRVATRPRMVWVVGTIVLLALAANLGALDLTQTQGTG